MVKPPFLQQGMRGNPTSSWLAVLATVIILFIAALSTMALFGPMLERQDDLVRADPGTATAVLREFALVDALVIIGGVHIIILLLLYGWIRVKERRGFESLGLRQPAYRKLMTGSLIGFGAVALQACGLTTFFGAELSWEAGQTAFAALLLALIMMPLVWLVQSLAEECLYRGFVLQSIGLHHGFIIAAFCSSILVAALHFETGIWGFAYFAGLAAFSFFLCLYAVTQNSLWGPIGCHASWNFGLYSVFSIRMPDSSHDEVSFFNALSRSPQLFGLETDMASFTTMFFITALILIVGVIIVTIQSRQ